MDQSWKLFTDGGARGNPGPAAAGYVIFEGLIVKHEGGKYLGVATNNVAEYQALILGLTSLAKFVPNNLQHFGVFMDSQLVINQLNGIYKIKQPHLLPLAHEIKEICNKNEWHPVFNYIPRTQNSLADKLVNQYLDRAASL